VEFLKRLYQNDLPFSRRSMDIVKDMMVLEDADPYPLRGKTGSGRMPSQYIGWFVGYEELEGNVIFFALNITSSSSEAKGSKAKQILLDILQEQWP
jgi:beta-lactamase class D